MKKILILGNRMECGGTEVVILSIINELLKDNNNHITLLLLEKSGVWLDRVPNEVQILEYCGPKTLQEVKKFIKPWQIVPFYWKALLRKCNVTGHFDLLLEFSKPLKEKFDLALDINGYGYLLTAYAAKRVHAYKKATWFHDEALGWVTKVSRYLSNYNKLFCVSNAVKNELVSLVPEYTDKIEVLYNPIDVEQIRKKALEAYDPIFKHDTTNLLTVGRIHPQKGILFLLQVAKRLKDKNIRFIWHIIGDGDLLEEYRQRAISMGLTENVIFWGRKNNPYPYMAHCDIYVQPSLHEGYGLTVLEARVLHKLILATDLPCFREQIQTGVNGYLLPANVEDFSDKIAEVINNIDNTKLFEMANQKTKVDFTNEMKKIQNLLK